MPEYLLGYMKDKVREIQVKVSGISEDQSNKVYETVISNLDKSADSKSFEAMMHDYNILGIKSSTILPNPPLKGGSNMNPLPPSNSRKVPLYKGGFRRILDWAV
jgi:hypothetical protein